MFPANVALGRRGPTPSKLAPQPWGCTGTALPGLVLRQGLLSRILCSDPFPSKSLTVATPCGLAWNCTLVAGSPSLWLLTFLSFILCCCLSSVLRFLPFLPVDSALLLERLIRLPLGKHFIRLGGMLSPVAGNPCFGGWPSPARASFLPV